MPHRRSAVALVAAIASAATLAPSPAAGAPEGAPMKMEAFQLVLLMRPAGWKPLPEAEASAIQARHLAYLGAMAESGRMVIAGPFEHQRDETYRGACLYRVATPEEARALAEADPAVKAGRLRVEVMTWWVGEGYMTFPKAPPTRASELAR